MTKTELKNRISEFMKKRYGDEIENSTDLSTVVPEDKVDSCINALMKEMKMNASATQVTIDKGTTIDTMATQMMDEMKAMDKEETMKEDVAEEEVVAAEDETVEEAAKKKKKKDDDDDEEEKDDDDDDDDKKDDDDDEELDEMYHAKKKKKKEEMQEQIESLFSQDETLSEEFKEKAALLFETVLTQRINEEVNELKEELEEQYNANLKEAVEAHAEQLHEELDNLTSKVDEYVTYVAEEWLKENELAVEKGVRTEITENFIFGLKNLFTENYIDVPEEKEDLVVSLEEKNRRTSRASQYSSKEKHAIEEATSRRKEKKYH